MSAFKQFKAGLNEAWRTLSEGWRRLYERAAGAVTRFRPGKTSGEDGTEGELIVRDDRQLAARNVGWGFMAAEVFEGDDEIVIRMEAPGMAREDFEIEVVGDRLVIRGEKHLRRERSEGSYHIAECAYGQFRRVLPLPDEVLADEARASYEQGILQVRLPRSPASRRRARRIVVD